MNKLQEIKIKHSRLYEQVIEYIEQMYKSGEIKLGDKLPPEREFAQKLGVSRGTLRDAFRILESQGVLETRAGGGRFLRRDIRNAGKSGSIIQDLQNAAVIDLLEARRILEIGMIELVCERATESDLKRLEEVIYQMGNREADTSFNLALAECSKNITIINFMKLNMEILNQTKERSFRGKEPIEKAKREHLEILEAIKARDVERAKQKVTEHLDNIIKRFNDKAIEEKNSREGVLAQNDE